MPGLVRKLVVCPDSDGLVLQPVHQRAQAQRGLRIDYKSHVVSPTTDTLVKDDLLLDCHGIVGIYFPQDTPE